MAKKIFFLYKSIRHNNLIIANILISSKILIDWVCVNKINKTYIPIIYIYVYYIIIDRKYIILFLLTQYDYNNSIPSFL